MVEQHSVKILTIQDVTHNVRAYRVEKPSGYRFIPGQATEVAIDMDGWREERRPFTFTGLNEDPYLEFTIKSYQDHAGVTNELYKLKAGDRLILHDVWGAIAYKGPGYFIAGGAGITPFIAILRQLDREKAIGDNRLFFSNKTAADIIYHKELKGIMGDRARYVLTQESLPQFEKGPIDKSFLRNHIRDFAVNFYVCGPDKMVTDIAGALAESGAKPDTVVFEK